MFKSPAEPGPLSDGSFVEPELLRNSYLLVPSLPNNLDLFKPKRHTQIQIEKPIGTFAVNIYSDSKNSNPFENVDFAKDVVIEFSFASGSGGGLSYEQVIKTLVVALISEYLPNTSRTIANVKAEGLPRGGLYLVVEGREGELKSNVIVEGERIRIHLIHAQDQAEALRLSLIAISNAARASEAAEG